MQDICKQEKNGVYKCDGTKKEPEEKLRNLPWATEGDQNDTYITKYVYDYNHAYSYDCMIFSS